MLKKLEKVIWRPTFTLPRPITDDEGFQEALSSYLYRFKREFVNELSLIIEELRLCYPKLHKKDFVSSMLDRHEIPLTYSGSGGASQYIAKVFAKMVADHDWSIHFLQRFNAQEQFNQPLKLKRKAGWCKHCITEWEAEGKPLYWPLAWLTQGYEKCHIHDAPLSYHCEHCGESRASFSTNLPINHCNYCKAPLSTSGVAQDSQQLEFWKSLRSDFVLDRLSINGGAEISKTCQLQS